MEFKMLSLQMLKVTVKEMLSVMVNTAENLTDEVSTTALYFLWTAVIQPLEKSIGTLKSSVKSLLIEKVKLEGEKFGDAGTLRISMPEKGYIDFRTATQTVWQMENVLPLLAEKRLTKSATYLAVDISKLEALIDLGKFTAQEIATIRGTKEVESLHIR
jgi:hypothetical protein